MTNITMQEAIELAIDEIDKMSSEEFEALITESANGPISYAFNKQEDTIMKSVQYCWGSMAGTFLVNCDILEKKADGTFRIIFWNDMSEENDERWVEKSELVFPDFADLVM